MSLFQYIHINSVEQLRLDCIYIVEYDIVSVRHFYRAATGVRQRNQRRSHSPHNLHCVSIWSTAHLAPIMSSRMALLPQERMNLDLSYLSRRRVIRIGVIGDSHMRRTHNYLGRFFLNNDLVRVELRNYSQGGAKAETIDMRGLLLWSPDVAFIWCGSNDLDKRHQGPISDHAHKISALFNRCQSVGIQAFTLGLPNRYACLHISPEEYKRRSNRVNSWLKRRSARGGRYIELPKICYDFDNYLPDGVHLNNYCYRQVAIIIRTKIMSIIES